MSDNSTATTVEAIDPGKKTSTIHEESGGDVTVNINKENDKCYWNDAEFSQGDQVKLDGNCYECSFGDWIIKEN